MFLQKNDLPLILLSDLLTTLFTSLPEFLKGLLLLVAHLLLLRGLDLDGVAKSINDLVLLLNLNLLPDSRKVVTLTDHLAITYDPALLAESRNELIVMRNNDNTTTEFLNGRSKSTKRITIKVVSGLIKNDEMGVLPSGSGKNDLDLLTTGETTNMRMKGKLRLKTKILKMLLDGGSGKGTTEETHSSGFLKINLINHLLETKLNELITGHPGALVRSLADPLNLVLVTLLQLTTSKELLNNKLTTTSLKLDLSPHLLGLLLTDLTSLFLLSLTIFTRSEAPLNIFVRGLVKMLLKMVEGVLSDVSNTKVRMLPNSSDGGLSLTSKDLDESRLTGTVGTQASNTGRKSTVSSSIFEDHPVSVRVLVRNLVHLKNSLILGLDTLKVSGLRKLESEGTSLKLIVCLSLRLGLDELRKVALVNLKLAVVVINDMGADMVEETRIVGNKDSRHMGEAGEVVFEPSNILDIQMVGGLIKKKNIRLHEHATGEGKLHLPTTRKGRDRLLLHGKVKADGREHLDDLLLIDSHDGLDILISVNELNARKIGLGAINIVLDVNGTKNILRRETIDLAVGNSPHKGRLTNTVGTAKTITTTTLEAKSGIVQKNLGTISKGEITVTKLITLLIIEVLSVLDGNFGLAAGDNGLGESLNAGSGDKDAEVRGENLAVPKLVVEDLIVSESGAHTSNVVKDNDGLVNKGILAISSLGKDIANKNQAVLLLHLLRHLLKTLLFNTLESLKAAVSDLAELRISGFLGNLLNLRHQTRKENHGLSRLLDELGHVVANKGSLTLNGSDTLTKTTEEEGNHDRKSRGLDGLDEGGRSELMNGVLDFGGVKNRVKDKRNDLLNIPVADKGAGLNHGLVGSFLDRGLGLIHDSRDSRNKIGESLGNLDRVPKNKVTDERDSNLLGSRVLLGVHTFIKVAKDSDNSISVTGINNGASGSLSSVFDSTLLVTSLLKDSRNEGNKERLSSNTNFLDNLGNGLKSGGAGGDSLTLKGSLKSCDTTEGLGTSLEMGNKVINGVSAAKSLGELDSLFSFNSFRRHLYLIRIFSCSPALQENRGCKVGFYQLFTNILVPGVL
mmetsp:Transcript_2434/g.3694  ORF Transcript_2434/g.3694 Transcript_2434/m.3694 type:complete len:1074 (+) Transcript_2434:2189-5410(+)